MHVCYLVKVYQPELADSRPQQHCSSMATNALQERLRVRVAFASSRQITNRQVSTYPQTHYDHKGAKDLRLSCFSEELDVSGKLLAQNIVLKCVSCDGEARGMLRPGSLRFAVC